MLKYDGPQFTPCAGLFFVFAVGLRAASSEPGNPFVPILQEYINFCECGQSLSRQMSCHRFAGRPCDQTLNRTRQSFCIRFQNRVFECLRHPSPNGMHKSFRHQPANRPCEHPLNRTHESCGPLSLHRMFESLRHPSLKECVNSMHTECVSKYVGLALVTHEQAQCVSHYRYSLNPAV